MVGNHMKLNVTLAEQNVPLTLCVAYVGQISIQLQGKFEFVDLELVVQTTPHNFSRHSDGMGDSLLSSVTALAFAAASVADDGTTVEPSTAESQYVEKIVEKVDSFVRNFGKPESVASSLVDDVVIDRAARLIDILFLGATVTFRDLRLRLQCPLTLNGAHRACDLRLQFSILEINNAEATVIESMQSATTTVTLPHHGYDREHAETLPKATTTAAAEHAETRGNLWSWFWSKTWIFGLNPMPSQPLANRGAEGSTGLPPAARKLFHFEGVTLHWDLWDTSNGQNFASSSSSTKSTSVSPSQSNSIQDSISLKDAFFSGPEPESMVASACLLSLPGPDNYLTIHVLQDSTILPRIISRPSQISRPTLVDLNVDLGPLVACLCPSQIFWLGAMVTQLTKLFEAYNTVQKARKQVEEDYGLNNLGNGDPTTGPFTDLDISLDDASVTSQSVDGIMFRSCLGASNFPLPDGGNDEAPFSTDSLPLSICARCRLLTLTLFYTDEAASFSHSFAPRSISVDSSGPEESFYEAFSSPLDPEPAQGALRIQNDFFTAVAGADRSVCDALNGKHLAPVAYWLEHVNLKLARSIQGRNHLRLSMGHCELEINPELNRRIKKDKDAEKGLLLSECLFSQDELTSSLQIVDIVSFSEPDNLLLPAIRLRSSDTVHYVELATVLLDLDPSLVDRVHRIVDALEAVQEISPIISRAIAEAADIAVMDDDRSGIHKWLGVEGWDMNLGRDHQKSYRSAFCSDHCRRFRASPIEIACASIHAVVRIPIPLESVPSLPSEDLDQMRKRLWAQTACRQECPLAWWKPCLRSESLAIRLFGLIANFGNNQGYPPGVMTYQIKFSQLEASFNGTEFDNKSFLVFKKTSNQGASSIFLRIAPEDRRCLSGLPVTSQSRSHHLAVVSTGNVTMATQPDGSQQMSSSLAMSPGPNEESFPLSVEPFQNEDVEEELIANVIAQSQRSPFIRRAMFLGEDLQNLWDKKSLLPGDSEHLKTYNVAASNQSQYLVVLSIPDVLLRVPNESALALLYTRLLTDLALWKSLLPSKRRTRAVLLVGGGLRPPFNVSDHRYWFYAEPVPIGSIYAHPSAALAAEERHRKRAYGLRFGESAESSSTESDANALTTPLSPELTEQYEFEGIHSPSQVFQPHPSFFSISIDSLEAQIRLDTSQKPFTTPLTAILASRSVTMTTEINPCRKSDLVYVTLTCGQIKCHVSGSIEIKNKSGANDNSSTQSRTHIPLLLPLTLSNDDTAEPMLSLAVEKRSIPIYGPLEPLAPSYSNDITVALKLRLGCLCYWPCLRAWMERFSGLQVDQISMEYASLFCPSYNIKIHWHLENSAFHMPPVCAFDGIVDGERMKASPISPAPTPGLDSLRPLIFAQNVTAFSKFVTPTGHIAFFERTALWLTPSQPVISAKKSQKLRMPSGEQQDVLSQAVWREVKALKCLLGDDLNVIIHRSVKVIDLDNLELRFVSKGVDSDGANQMHSPRVDVRLTVNLIRLTTCLDSLVALRLILEGFNRSPESPPPRKLSEFPVLINPPLDDESSRRSKIENLISAAISDVDVVNCPPLSCLTITQNEEDFLVIAKESSEMPPRRQPVKVLKDGTQVMSYSPILNICEDFYGESKCLAPIPKRQGLFSDPFGSESLFAFTIHDVSVEWTFFGGLDFPSLCSGTDVEENLRRSLSIPNLCALSSFCRQNDQNATLRLSNVYFRKSIFKPPADYQPFRHRTRKISNFSGSPFSIVPISNHPVARYALRITDLKIVDGLPQSMINHLFHVQQGRAREGSRFIEAVRATVLMWPSSTPVITDYEAEVKVSIQPLQINLDQAMFVFLRAHHTALTQLTERYLQDMEKRVCLFCVRSSSAEGNGETASIYFLPPASTSSEDEDQPIFFKRLTLTPSLPIRFNYHGHQLDLSQGPLIGLLALCLRLKNAELVLPRWVYQRGYRGVYSLIEEIISHWTSTLHNNLLQILATSIGPMNEISSILVGVRDFVLHSVTAFATPLRSFHRNRNQCLRRQQLARPSADQVVQGLRSGVRALSDNTVWPIVELSTEGVRTVQCLFETVFDVLSPGPSIRNRRLGHVKQTNTSVPSYSTKNIVLSKSGDELTPATTTQPNDLREGAALAVQTIRRNAAHFAADFKASFADPDPQKGSVGALGDVLRQIPPATVVPFVIGCEVGANLLHGLRNQLRPEAKLEDREKWKSGSKL
ncbi:autophagy protein 2 B [Echinococcus multilocularis]|uniref:Autophagy-related protein 2 n=1 Tax=Echinococcus multilocularis TaxID=6211 RepID=A0A068YM60_ECHMU|nr:autophagy protein 2 B [Echinococcus multilocularis]